MHINCLELTAAMLAVQVVAKDRSGVSILLQLDNQTAVAYINHLGGTVSLQLVQLAKALWLWALQQEIMLSAQHIPGVTNQVADAESRVTGGRLDWKLSPRVFRGSMLLGVLWRWICLHHACPLSWTGSSAGGRIQWRKQPMLFNRTGPPEGLCQPSLVFDRESSQTSESPAGSGDSSGPSVEGSVMVSSSLGDALGLSLVDSSLSGSISHDLQLSGNEFSAPASRMAYLREKFASQNLSGTARDLLLASWRTKSNKTYDSHFNKWLCWCSARGSDPISGPVSEIANFLAHLHKEGYRSSSLNVFRSAISSVHDKVDGVDVGKHPTVTRLLKGAFHERPPLPRYTSTWDVNAVLLYLKSLGPTSDLTLKQLTYKLVMLLALTRPSRSADLSSLSLARRRFCPEGVTFLPATLAKQSRQGKPLVEFFFPCFPHD